MTMLNKQQKHAAEFMNGLAAVIAVPGSGKTLTMTHRIGNLVKNGVSPEQILGLTFTRNAAQSMRDKLKSVLNELASRVNLSTIHSFCHSLLKQEGRVFDLLYGKQQIILLRSIMRELKTKDLSIGMILREISLAKTNLISSDEFREIYEGDDTMEKVSDIYKSYEAEKSKKMLLDFDDLLVETHNLLRDNDEVRDKYSTPHILVDEFQDTNPIQMEILRLLINNSDKKGSFWVCGDDWQSIYSFTGASVGNILKFKEVFPDSKQFILNMNYRSTPQILRACQNLISHNVKKIDKTLETQNDNGEEVIIIESSTEVDEGVQIMNEIKDLVSRKGYNYKDIAILYRANFQSCAIEDVFSQHNIPYHIETGHFYERREVKLLLDYLRLIDNPNSDEADEALASIINVPNRYIGKKFLNELQLFSENKEVHLYHGLKTMPVTIPYLKKNIRDFITFVDPLIKNKNLTPVELITLLRESLDYDKYITNDDIPSPDDSKIANIDQLLLASSKYNDIKSFLTYTETFKDNSNNDKEGISLLTIHKSKGLEFPVVFIIGLVEGILPSNRDDNIEEERRIAFVGCSRAMKLLYLSYFHTYSGNDFESSRFLKEILNLKK